MSRVAWYCTLGLIVAGSASAAEWVTNGPRGGVIRDLLASPHSPSTLFAAASSDGLFKSTDDGRTWRPVAEELGEGFCAVVADPSDPEALYGVACSSTSKVARSFDGGETWEVVPDSVARELVVDPQTPSTLYATTVRTVGKSTDRGSTWEYLGAGQLFLVSTIAIDPVRPSTLYVISGLPTGGLGVWKSTDGARSWTPSSAGVEERRGFDALLVDPVDPDVVYLGTGSGLFRSQDAGASWAFDPVLPPVESLTVDPADPGVVYALTRSGGLARIFRTLDQGASWATFGAALPAAGPDEGLFFHKVVRAGSGRWFAASDCGVYRAAAGALGWERAIRGLKAGGMSSVVADPERPRVLYAGNNTCGVFKSSNGGRSWARQADPSHSGAYSLAIDPRSPRRLYAGTLRGIYRTQNGGRSWRRIPTRPPAVDGQVGRDFVRVDPHDPRNLYAGWLRYLLFSQDRGASWSLGDLGRDRKIVRLRELVVHPGDSSVVFLASRGRGVLRSTDGGATWRSRSRGLPRLASRLEVWDLAIDPRDGEILYASLPTRGIYKSVNGARRWLPANGGIETISVLSILIDPLDSATLYAGTLEDGVFRSRDAGRSWRPLGDLEGVPVHDLTRSGSTLHAAAANAVYSYELAD